MSRTFRISPEVSRLPEVKDSIFLSLFLLLQSSCSAQRLQRASNFLTSGSWGTALPDWKVDVSIHLALCKTAPLSLWVGDWANLEQKDLGKKEKKLPQKCVAAINMLMRKLSVLIRPVCPLCPLTKSTRVWEKSGCWCEGSVIFGHPNYVNYVMINFEKNKMSESSW